VAGVAVTSSISEVRAATPTEWDAAFEACPHATASHSRGWAEDWSQYTHGMMRPAPLLLRLDDGSRLVIPLTRKRRHHGLASQYLSAPAGTYGGWISADPLEEPRARAVAEWLLEHRSPLWWRLNPFDPHAAALEALATQPEETHAVHLEAGFSSACERATHGHRCAVRKAQRNGLTVRRAASAADWEAYYAVYLDTLRRWGEQASSRYEPLLFDLLRRRGAPAVELWLAALESGEIIAGGLALYAPHHVMYWHAAARAEHFALRPANLLVHEMMLDACARGLEWFDLNPSGGHAGVRTFKERLGAVALPASVVIREHRRSPLLPGGRRRATRTSSDAA
jgi:CelD/BcsL family acetyltransferase involved in cellulose biosynthesis